MTSFRVIDGIFHALHWIVISFSTLGWLSPPLRVWHLGLQALIFVSWFVLGAYKGWGYCWLTDRQWTYRQRHGTRPSTESFVEHWLNDIFGLNLSSALIQKIIMTTWLLTTLASLAMWMTGR